MMAAVVTITHNRFPEIARKLPVQTRAVVRKTAYDVESHAKAIVPVDTGTLKNSIETRISPDGLYAVIEPHTEYAIYVEFGTRNPNYPKQPYMTPAGEANKQPFINAMERMLRSL